MPSTLQLPEEFRKEIEPYLDAAKPTEKQALWSKLRIAALWVGIGLLTMFFVYNLTGFHHLGIDETGLIGTIRGNESNDRYRRAMEWGAGHDAAGNENILAGSGIFNCLWVDFSVFF